MKVNTSSKALHVRRQRVIAQSQLGRDRGTAQGVALLLGDRKLVPGWQVGRMALASGPPKP